MAQKKNIFGVPRVAAGRYEMQPARILYASIMPLAEITSCDEDLAKGPGISGDAWSLSGAAEGAASARPAIESEPEHRMPGTEFLGGGGKLPGQFEAIAREVISRAVKPLLQATFGIKGLRDGFRVASQ